MWEMDLLPRLRRVLAQCNGQSLDTIELDAQVHNSVGIALGSLFPETSRYSLRIRQQDQWRSSRAKPTQSRAFQQHEVALATSQEAIDQHLLFDSLKNCFDLNDLQDLCFKLSIRYEDLAGNNLSAKARELIVYMRQRSRLAELQQVIAQERPNIAEQLHLAASERQQISLELASARSLDGVSGDAEKAIRRQQLPITRRIQVGIADVSDESHAQSIAKQLRALIVDLRDGGYRQPIHLFAALPVGLAIMLGCQLNACGPIQLYEYNKDGDKLYYPAWRYNS